MATGVHPYGHGTHSLALAGVGFLGEQGFVKNQPSIKLFKIFGLAGFLFCKKKAKLWRQKFLSAKEFETK